MSQDFLVAGGTPAAIKIQPLKKALYPNKEAKSTLYSNKEPFYARRARDRGEAPKPLPAGGLAPATGSS